MLILNIIGTLLHENYPAIFLVWTPLMTEAESDPGVRVLAAEVLFEAAEDQSRKSRSSCFDDETSSEQSSIARLSILVGRIPLAVIGGLSGFQTQSSTSLQRGFHHVLACSRHRN